MSYEEKRVEPLAVIVILAVIVLITTPLIMEIIDDAKKNAFRDSAYGIIKAVQNDSMKIGIQTGGFAVGKYNLAEGELNYKGSLPKQGKVALIYPSLYLKTTIKVAGGVGSRTNPYIIEK